VGAVPPAMSLFDLLKFSPLFVVKIGGDLLVCFHYDLMNAPAGVAPYLPKLGSRLVDNWRNLRDLFRCQTKFRPKALFHSVAHMSWAVNFEEKVPSVESPYCSPSDPTGYEYKNKSGNKFPL
jgi:hypothetical protein